MRWIHRTRHRMVRHLWRHHRTSDDRQRPQLPHLTALPTSPHRCPNPSPTDSSVSAPNQRQGRTIQPDPHQRMGLRPALRDEPSPPRFARHLAPRLQLAPIPHRSRRGASNTAPRQQRLCEGQLARRKVCDPYARRNCPRRPAVLGVLSGRHGVDANDHDRIG